MPRKRTESPAPPAWDDEDPRGDAGSEETERYMLQRRYGDAAEAAQRVGKPLDLRPSRTEWRACARQAAFEAEAASQGLAESARSRLERAAAMIAAALWRLTNQAGPVKRELGEES